MWTMKGVETMDVAMRRFKIIGSQNDRDRLEKLVIEKRLTHDDIDLILKTIKKVD